MLLWRQVAKSSATSSCPPTKWRDSCPTDIESSNCTKKHGVRFPLTTSTPMSCAPIYLRTLCVLNTPFYVPDLMKTNMSPRWRRLLNCLKVVAKRCSKEREVQFRIRLIRRRRRVLAESALRSWWARKAPRFTRWYVFPAMGSYDAGKQRSQRLGSWRLG